MAEFYTNVRFPYRRAGTILEFRQSVIIINKFYEKEQGNFIKTYVGFQYTLKINDTRIVGKER